MNNSTRSQHRFRIVQRFDVLPKPGICNSDQRLEELTAIPDDDGDLRAL